MSVSKREGSQAYYEAKTLVEEQFNKMFAITPQEHEANKMSGGLFLDEDGVHYRMNYTEMGVENLYQVIAIRITGEEEVIVLSEFYYGEGAKCLAEDRARAIKTRTQADEYDPWPPRSTETIRWNDGDLSPEGDFIFGHYIVQVRKVAYRDSTMLSTAKRLRQMSQQGYGVGSGGGDTQGLSKEGSGPLIGD